MYHCDFSEFLRVMINEFSSSYVLKDLPNQLIGCAVCYKLILNKLIDSDAECFVCGRIFVFLDASHLILGHPIQ
jgi:hypothetical protein